MEQHKHSKNPAMILARTLVDINGYFTQNNNTVRMLKDDELLVINRSSIARKERKALTGYRGDFWAALEDLKATRKDVDELFNELDVIIKEAESRICQDCGGSGDESNSDPESPLCKSCGGVGLS